jgi:hypothetical protein
LVVGFVCGLVGVYMCNLSCCLVGWLFGVGVALMVEILFFKN